ncbi:NADPH-dependent aldehyde reductase-like protein, chloroplastic [Phragmites australis]|uniref:NADPH-dependent aldehyde reductase-like protein, chloroplastic n=1 Tax=Phragmites australis TaxID=29695 RepID=UPI002D78C519|nr:NADPH-dependent aldehyde reductase-like protein, chloroplastic [Phragmites australis]
MAESSGVAATASMMLHGRVAIVTGGAGGIGSVVCKHLASLGARVAVAYIGDPAPALELVSGINGSKHAGAGDQSQQAPRAIAVEADVSDATQVRALFDAAAAAFGGELHILVTCAAVLDYSYPPLAETSEATYDAAFGINARGTFLCCREAARRLARDGRGRIVTFSSSGVASLRPGYAAYAASKAAVEVMTKILARELRGTGITANAVAPGSTGTPMMYTGKTEEDIKLYIAEAPLGRLGMPEDIAPLVGFLASDAGHWVNAQVLRCNGGTI